MHAHFRRQRIEIQQRNVPVVPPVIEVPLTITDIEMEPEVAHEIRKLPGIDLPVRTVTETPPVAASSTASPAVESPPSDPDTTSHPVPTTKSNSVITALPSIKPPPVVIDISNDSETDSDNEEMKLKTVATIADIHPHPQTAVESIIQPNPVAPAIPPPVKETKAAFESPPTNSDLDNSSDSVTDFLDRVEPQIVVVDINPQPQTVVDQKSAPKSLTIEPKIISAVTSTKVLTGLDDIVVDRSSNDDPDATSSPAFEMKSHVIVETRKQF